MELYSAPGLLKAMVRFPSLSYEEDEIASFLASYAQQHGVNTWRLENNVCFSIGDGDRRLLFNSHLDVVPPSNGHPYDPFDPVEVDGLIYGRGTADAKGSGAAMLTALLELQQEGWTPASGQLIVALTSCEEVGAEDNGLQTLRPHLPSLSAGVVGEPTSLQPIIAQKGLLILKVTAIGTSAHAARAHLGDNAITKAASDIETLERYTFTHQDPILGAPTLCVTVIQGGSARNVVPDQCTFYVDVRTTPGRSHDDIVRDLQAVLQSRVEIHSGRIIPVSTPQEACIVQTCLDVLPNTSPAGSPTASDWIYLHDIPVVKMGPGSSERSHTADEHVPAAEVSRAAQVYKNIAQRYFERC